MQPSANNNCIFCQIISGKYPEKILFQDEKVTAFRDIHPLTPVHILIVPNQHITSINQIEPSDEPLLGHLFTIAKELASHEGIDQSGYRLVINTEKDAGQSVFHLHLHLIGGTRMPVKFG